MKIQVVALVCLSSALFGVSEGWARNNIPHERPMNTKKAQTCDKAQMEAAHRLSVLKEQKACNDPQVDEKTCGIAKDAVMKSKHAINACAEGRKGSGVQE